MKISVLQEVGVFEIANKSLKQLFIPDPEYLKLLKSRVLSNKTDFLHLWIFGYMFYLFRRDISGFCALEEIVPLLPFPFTRLQQALINYKHVPNLP